MEIRKQRYLTARGGAGILRNSTSKKMFTMTTTKLTSSEEEAMAFYYCWKGRGKGKGKETDSI